MYMTVLLFMVLEQKKNSEAKQGFQETMCNAQAFQIAQEVQAGGYPTWQLTSLYPNLQNLDTSTNQPKPEPNAPNAWYIILPKNAKLIPQPVQSNKASYSKTHAQAPQTAARNTTPCHQHNSAKHRLHRHAQAAHRTTATASTAVGVRDVVFLRRGRRVVCAVLYGRRLRGLGEYLYLILGGGIRRGC
jgi:hypothetical protein